MVLLVSLVVFSVEVPPPITNSAAERPNCVQLVRLSVPPINISANDNR